MFNDLVESVVSRKKTNKGWAVMISAVFQSAWLIVLILIPLIYTQALPKAILSTVLIAPAPPAPSPAPPDAKLVKSVRRLRFLDHNILHAPTVIPRTIAVITEDELAPDSPPATPGQLLGLDLFRDLARTANPVAPPPSRSNSSNIASRIKLGGQVQAAKIISQSQPTYPALARQARIQGTVVLRAIIGTDGLVNELQVISGHPLLVQAALDAVKRWRYQPTLLNDQPVEVDTTISVIFVLGE
jgi:periplasmic protein TonB